MSSFTELHTFEEKMDGEGEKLRVKLSVELDVELEPGPATLGGEDLKNAILGHVFGSRPVRVHHMKVGLDKSEAVTEGPYCEEMAYGYEDKS